MNPSQQHQQQHEHNHNHHSHAKRDTSCPPPLKINKDSHLIKKSSSSSSASSLVTAVAGPAKPQQQQQRHPVIIYTHSPKVIHTHPRDFMALVQKLTGLSRSEDDVVPPQAKPEVGPEDDNKGSKNNNINIASDDNDSSSVITDENCSSGGDGQVNSSPSCMVPPPMFESPASNPYLTNIPVFTPNSADFLCPNQPFYNYTDSLFFNPNMRSSISRSSTLDGIAEYREF